MSSESRPTVLGEASRELRAPELARVREALTRSEAIIYPTETLYGLGAAALDARAAQRVRTIKGRPEDKPFPLLIADRDMLERIVRDIPPVAHALMERYWPGALTLVLPGRPELPPGVRGADGSVACRLSSSPVATALVRALGAPLIATSANRAGQPAHRRLAGALDEIGTEVAVAVDGGELPGRRGSTIVDVTVSPPRILRDGDLEIELPPAP